MRLTVTACLAALTLAQPALAATCTLPPKAQAMQAEVVALTNLQRKKQGLAPLAANPALTKAAVAHACDNARTGRMSHQGSDGSTLPQRLERAGYAWREAYENVAAGFIDAPSVMSGWMASKGHRRNILSPGAVDVGIGIAVGAKGMLYWTMDLGRPR